MSGLMVPAVTPACYAVADSNSHLGSEAANIYGRGHEQKVGGISSGSRPRHRDGSALSEHTYHAL